MMIQVREKVRFVETDLMGVVHHSNYLSWFEMARVEYLRKANILLLDLIRDGIVFPITKVECKYISSAYFDDWLIIEAVMIECHKAKMEFAYQITREADQTVLAEGYTQNLFTTSGGKVTRLPNEYFDKLKNIKMEENQIPDWAKKWMRSGKA